MSDWLEALAAGITQGETCALVTVADTQGSTPRERGAKMIVTRDGCYGTIGGGNLEFKAIEVARELLAHEGKGTFLLRFPLGPSLGQCCGGVAVLLLERIAGALIWVEPLLELRRRGASAVLVSQTEAVGKLVVSADGGLGSLGDDPLEHAALAIARNLLVPGSQVQLRTFRLAEDDRALLFEPLHPSDFHVTLFGAGHVGKALASLLAQLPCTLNWIDSRADQFPPRLPANVSVQVSDAPEYEVDAAPPGSFFLVMTHSHPLDQAICEWVLRRGDFRYLGLIGSASKRRSFEKRWLLRGISAQTLERLTCPIGVAGIDGKQPLEIAIAVAAQLLQVRGHAVNQRLEPELRRSV